MTEDAGAGMAEDWATPAELVGRRQMEAAGAPDRFRATGFEPALDLALAAEQAPGWYEIELSIEAAHALQVRILPGFGGEIRADRASVLRQPDPGRFTGTFKAPAAFRILRLEPGRRPGDIRIADLRLTRMGTAAILAMALAGARRAARMGPAPLLRFLRDALGTVLRPRRFQTFQPAASVAADAPDAEARYRSWIERHEPLIGAGEAAAPGPAALAVVIPAPAGTPAGALAATLASLAALTRDPAEILLAGPAGSLDDPAGEQPARLRRIAVPAGASAADCVAAALDQVESRHVVVLAPGDRARPRLAQAFAAVLDRVPDLDLAYADEDRLDAGGARCRPSFKPGWSPAFLEGGNFLGRPVLLSLAAIRAVGGVARDRPGAEDFDLALKIGLTPGAKVERVAEVLVSRPETAGPGWAAADEAPAVESGRRALEDHFARTAPGASVAPIADLPGRYRVRRSLPDPAPLVSLLIPTRDRLDLLAACIGSVRAVTRYPAYEILVIDNGSEDPATRAWLTAEAEAGHIRVLRDDGPFDFARLNNSAAAAARGDLLCLMNNDIEAIEPDWLTAMAALARMPDVGPVGAKLLYPDRTVQHGGVMLGLHGIAGHIDTGVPADDPGHLGRLRADCEVAAVTAACLVVRRSVWDELGGLDPALPVAFNDFDFCLLARRAGYRCLFAGSVSLVHHESASRGADRDAVRRERYRAEAAAFKARWGESLLDDPYVSPHLDRAEGIRAAQL